MALHILGVPIPENLDSFKVTENGVEKDIEEVIVYGVSRWKKQKYYWIIYNVNGGSGSMNKQTMPVGIATALSPNAFGRLGYLFDGWSVNGVNKTYGDAQVVTDIATAGQTLTLYALWKGITYYIDYYGNGATGGETARSTHTYDVNGALSPNGYVRTGYLFNGWQAGNGAVYANQQNVLNLSAANGSVVGLNALWAPVTYYVQYNGNGADSGSMAASTHTYDTAKPLSVNGFSRNGYKYLGWSDDGGKIVRYKNGQSVINLSDTNQAVYNLYAVWMGTVVADWAKDCSELTGGIARGNSNGEYADNAFWESYGRYGHGYIPNGGYWWICTKGMIDLTYINSIHFEVDCGYNHMFTAGVTKTFGLNNMNKSTYAKVYQDEYYHETETKFRFDLDVSDLTGAYYIQTQADQDMHNGYATYQIWNTITLS